MPLEDVLVDLLGRESGVQVCVDYSLTVLRAASADGVH